MTRPHVEFLRPADRSALTQMLGQSSDFPPGLLTQYQSGRGPYRHLVAWQGDRLDGVLTGSFDTDLSQSGAFAGFELPAAPHAFLARVHVRDEARGGGVGLALAEEYAATVIEYRSSFIGGSLDLSTDPRVRRAFFEGLGFDIRRHDNFGAYPEDVLAAVAARRGDRENR